MGWSVYNSFSDTRGQFNTIFMILWHYIIIPHIRYVTSASIQHNPLFVLLTITMAYSQTFKQISKENWYLYLPRARYILTPSVVFSYNLLNTKQNRVQHTELCFLLFTVSNEINAFLLNYIRSQWKQMLSPKTSRDIGTSGRSINCFVNCVICLCNVHSSDTESL